MVRMYVDGSSIKKPRAAWGSACIVVGYKRWMPFIEGGLNETNQRAELNAIYTAFKAIWANKGKMRNEGVLIVGDSQYAINCVTVWKALWREKNVPPEKISHYDIISKMWELLDRCEEYGINVEFKHVRGHGKDKTMEPIDVAGNRMADMFATYSSKQWAVKGETPDPKGVTVPELCSKVCEMARQIDGVEIPGCEGENVRCGSQKDAETAVNGRIG